MQPRVMTGRMRNSSVEGFERSPQKSLGSLMKPEDLAKKFKQKASNQKNLIADFNRKPSNNGNSKVTSNSFIDHPAQDGKPGDFKMFQRNPKVTSGKKVNGKAETDKFLRSPSSTGISEDIPIFTIFERRLKAEGILENGKLFLKEPGLDYYQCMSDLKDISRYTARLLYTNYGIDKDAAVGYATSEKTMRTIFKELQVDPDVAARHVFFEGMDNYLNVTNGIVAVHNGVVEFKDKAPEFAFKYCLNACFDETANGVNFEKFLAGFIGNDQTAHRRFWQLMGHLLFENISGKALVWFYGKGDDGKSEFVKFLQKILRPSVATYSADIGTAFDKHGPAYFQNAKILFLHETNKALTQTNVDIIKRLTGGDAITVNPKNKDMSQQDLCVKILITGNHLPSFAPGVLDDALKRRLQFVRVYSVPQEERIEKVSTLLFRERDYFLTKAVQGFADLQKTGFNFSSCSKDDELERVIFGNDVAGVFLEECCNINKDAYVFTDTFKKFAENWLKSNDCEWSVRDLRKAIVAKGYVYSKFRANGDNRWGFRGFSIKT